ncbi:MAG: TetR/AcrR family transcriptional regulator [Solirubrobacteraceae bacterium]|nr:TetR/AcrR family transcriptional regulator [Solirubrobacteraceae bacterium]
MSNFQRTLMTDQKRPYRMKARAELQERTRLRITESAVELHGTLGPARTSMSAVAQHAGVRRSTLYRHFPDESALFVACSGHWAAQHPLPDLEAWAAVREPDDRLRLALTEVYGYYVTAEPMLANLLRDLDVVEAVREQFAGFLGYMQAAQTTLMAGRPARGRAAHRTRAAIGHALAFTTWRSLVGEQDCSAKECVDLMCRLAAS